MYLYVNILCGILIPFVMAQYYCSFYYSFSSGSTYFTAPFQEPTQKRTIHNSPLLWGTIKQVFCPKRVVSVSNLKITISVKGGPLLFVKCLFWIAWTHINTRRFSNHESRLISRSHTFAIIVILDLKIQIKVCGYTDPFSKNLNQRSLTPRWPLTPCLLRSHMWLYPRIIVSKSHDNTSMYVDTVINFAKYHIHTYTYYVHTTYYVQNEWSHSLLLNSVQARQLLNSVQARQKCIIEQALTVIMVQNPLDWATTMSDLNK